jgi:hypothetical protein
MRLGLYLVYSGHDDQSPIRERLARDFLARFAGTTPRLAPAAATSVSLNAFGGNYRAAGFSGTNYEKLRSLAARVRVRRAGDAIAIGPPGGAPAVILHRVSNLTFRGDSGEVIAFKMDPDGVARRFTLSGSV